MEDMLQLMRIYGLVALNTWRRPTPQAKASTFRFGDTESQIDFLLVRRGEAADQAKQAHPVRSFHVGASRHGGAIRFPIAATLQLRCPHWVKRPTMPTDRRFLLDALDRPTCRK